jgi:hypothetical protein
MGGGGWDVVGLPLSLGVYSVVREGASAAAERQLDTEFNRGTFSTYTAVVLEVEIC